MAQIRQVVSESLQATVRRLLPSQQGFTEDLQASNVIMPIIDLTPTAEGSSLSEDLARALSFDSITAFNANNSTVTVANTAGFYRIFGVSNVNPDGAADRFNVLSMSDGLSSKNIWEHRMENSGVLQGKGVVHFDFVVFLTSGGSVSAQSSAVDTNINGCSRQIADVNGNIVNPSGFTSS